jgi:dihydrofolate reductase
MGTLIAAEFTTLDGVAQAPGGPDEDRESGFAHGGWWAPFADEEGGRGIYERASTMDALLLGRRTYDIFAAYWPQADPDNPFTELLNRVPKYVASRTLTEPLTWEGASVLDGDLAASVAALKERHAEVQVIGSLDLLQSLLGHGLVDRLDLMVGPVVLGTGKRVFEPGATPTSLRLTDSTVYANGVALLSYAPAGAPTYGELG